MVFGRSKLSLVSVVILLPLWVFASNSKPPLPESCQALLLSSLVSSDFRQAATANRWPLNAFLESGRHDSAGLDARQTEQALLISGLTGVSTQGPLIDEDGHQYYLVAATIANAEELHALLLASNRHHMKAKLPTPTIPTTSPVPSRPTIEELRTKFLRRPPLELEAEFKSFLREKDYVVSSFSLEGHTITVELLDHFGPGSRTQAHQPPPTRFISKSGQTYQVQARVIGSRG